MINHAKRALELFDYALENNLAGNKKELCEKIGINPHNISTIGKGKRAFTHEQMIELCRLTNGNMNWVYGFDKNKFREKKHRRPIDLVRELAAMLEK